MKLRSIILIALFGALLSSPVWAWGVMGMAGGSAAAGCSEGSGYVIVGGDYAGTPTCDGHSYQIYTGAVHWRKYTATQSCTIDRLAAYIYSVGTGGNIRMCINADNSGEVGTLLGSTPECTASVGGEYTLSSPVAITQGNVYWIGATSDSADQISVYNAYTGGTTDARYTSWTYSSSGAMPNGGTYTARNVWFCMEALTQ